MNDYYSMTTECVEAEPKVTRGSHTIYRRNEMVTLFSLH